MNLTKFGINQVLLKDTAIASVVTQVAPKLLEKVWAGYATQSETIKQVAEAGVGWLVGYLMKNKNIQTISIALALSDLVAAQLNDMVDEFLPSAQNFFPAPKAYKGTADYMHFSEYIDAPEVTRNYANYYN